MQAIIEIPDPSPLPALDPCHPSLPRVRKMLGRLDMDEDGRVSRRDMLMAFRRDRQLADHLKMPPRIKVGT